MNNLFARTLLWFVVTVVLTFLAMLGAALYDADREERERPPYGAIMLLQFSEARFAYETGGPAALRATLRRFRQATRTEGILTDPSGRDLATGENRRDLFPAIGARPRRPYFHRGRPVFGRVSADGRYAFFLVLQRPVGLRWLLQPEVHLAMLLVLLVFSYAFARHLTNPVMRLQKAVERFGKGELGARVKSTRKDEIGDLARTFDQMADRMETLLGAERRLLMDISHELRSPLARLSVALELARSDGAETKHLDRIQKEIDRLNSLVGELLQVTRAEGDAAQMQFEDVELRTVIDELTSDVRLEAEARGCRLEWSSSDAFRLRGHAELLRRAIENVLRNAVRHAPSGSTVTVNLTQSGNFAIVTIRDCGPGVAEEHLSRIFDPFYRVESDRDRASGGVGLGLSIARRAIELHRGEISARNADPGLLVEMRLPL